MRWRQFCPRQRIQVLIYYTSFHIIFRISELQDKGHYPNEGKIEKEGNKEENSNARGGIWAKNLLIK